MTVATTATATATPVAVIGSALRSWGARQIEEAAAATAELADALKGSTTGAEMAGLMAAALRARHLAAPWESVLTGNTGDDAVIASATAMLAKAVNHLLNVSADNGHWLPLEGVERGAISEGYRAFASYVKPLLDHLEG
ncbi:hypothetical protein [Nonomuraea salmonea]|uniref:DUF4259 domain-containing protein n=1 Tax=Nonomuraea salmonea TaxID=46181 RepID=A0ABV5P2X8_9ACTN